LQMRTLLSGGAKKIRPAIELNGPGNVDSAPLLIERQTCTNANQSVPKEKPR
jgi:hypothetical protein